MDHKDHIALIRDGIPELGGIWADFGSGSGAFTLALAELMGSDGLIYSVDVNANVLNKQARIMRSRYPDLTIHYLNLDYTQPLDLPPLDGAIMANALHFQRQKDEVVQSIRGYLQPAGRLILVEYNVDHGNHWVPYPISFETWEALARRNGFTKTRLLAKRSSRFLGEIYAAVSWINPSSYE